MANSQWQSPSFIEVDMSAEIGGYQGDYGPRDGEGPDYMPDFVQSEPSTRATEG